MYTPRIKLGDARYQLHFGPYGTPRFRQGQTVIDEIRGEVVIVEVSAGRIPWPIGKLGRHKALVMFRGLARAVRHESNIAICHWWGVTPQTVTRWRNMLQVSGPSEGTSKLRAAYGANDGFAHVLRAAHAKARDPGRRAKISAALTGRKLSADTIEKLRAANLGKKMSEEARQKMREAAKRRRQPEDASG